MNLYDEFFSIIEAFENHDITYGVIGGFAMAFHDEPRFTEDIDILVGHDDFHKAEEVLTKLNFFSSTDPHHFLDTKLSLYRYVKTFDDDYLVVDLLWAKENKFEEMLKNTIYYNWEKGKVAVINRKDLISLKRMRNSDQDKVDIKKLTEDE